MLWTVCSKNGSQQFILIWVSHQCQNLHGNVSISSVRTETACLLFQAASHLIKRRCHFFFLLEPEDTNKLHSGNHSTGGTLGLWNTPMYTWGDRAFSLTLVWLLQEHRARLWKQRLGGSRHHSRREPLWYSPLRRETLAFQSNREEASDGESKKKRGEKKHAFEKWAGEWSQEAKWGDGGEKTELGCSLVWQHHCHRLEEEKEAGWHRDGASVRADLFLILSLSDHNLSPTFFIAFRLTSPV